MYLTPHNSGLRPSNLNGKSIKDRNITINEAKPRTDSRGGSGGGSGGGFGSRRY